MLKLVRTKMALLALSIAPIAAGFSACGEEAMMPKQPVVYSFKHKLPASLKDHKNFSSHGNQPFIDSGILFWGNAIRDRDNAFDIGIQFSAETEGRKVFVKKLYLDTPNLQIERVVDEYVELDVFSDTAELYFKRFLPFEKISGESIPLDAEFFILKIDYRIDDQPTKQMSIRFDNASFLGPIR